MSNLDNTVQRYNQNAYKQQRQYTKRDSEIEEAERQFLSK